MSQCSHDKREKVSGEPLPHIAPGQGRPNGACPRGLEVVKN